MKKLILQGLVLAIILITSSNCVFAQNTLSSKKGDTPIANRDFMGMTLELILKEIAKEYELELDYDPAQLRKGLMPIKIYRNITLSKMLTDLLIDTNLQFFLNNQKLVLRPKVVNLSKAKTTDNQKSSIDIEKTKLEMSSNDTEIASDDFIEYKPTRFNITVNGVVKDRKSGETLPNVTVQLYGTSKGTITNLDGNFTLFNVPSDTTTLFVRYLGYQSAVYKITPEDAKDKLLIEIEDVSIELGEVVVTAEKESNMMKKSENISQISISPAQVSTLPSIGEKDIFRALQMLPGVSGSNEASSGLFVRGGTPDQNLVLLDGFTVYYVDHFFGFFSAFNANAIKDVQLFKGGFEAKYGGRISSVVDLTGKNGNTKKFDMGVGFSALSANAFFEIPINKKTSFIFTARRSYTDIIQSGLFDKIFKLSSESNNQNNNNNRVPNFLNQTQPSFYFYDLNAKLTYNISNKDILSVSLYNGRDNLDNARQTNPRGGGGFPGGGFPGGAGGGFPTGGLGNFNIQNDTKDLTYWGNNGASVKWARTWSPKFYSNAVLAYSNYFSNRNRTTKIEITNADGTTRNFGSGLYEDNNVQDVSFRFDNEYKINPKNQLEFGLQLTHNQIDYVYTSNDTTTVYSNNGVGNLAGMYVQNRWSPLEKLSIKYGLRGTYYDVTKQYYIEPRISASYQLTDKISLQGAWGKYNQFINRIVREDVTAGSRDFWLLANDQDVPISSATHYIGGVSYENDNYLFSVEAYRKDMTGLSEFTLRLNRANVTTINSNNNFFRGTGYSQGVEFLAQRKVGKFTGWASYTLSEVIYNFPQISEQSFYALQDQTHEFKMVGSYNIGRWTLSGTWVYATGKPYTAPIGGYELTLLDGSKQSYVSVGDKNSFRLPNYHRMDLAFTYHFKIDEAKAEAGITFFNVYNRTNVRYKEFEVIDNQIYETNVNLLGFTPNFFFNFKLR
jgi:hypothetical protein